MLDKIGNQPFMGWRGVLSGCRQAAVSGGNRAWGSAGVVLG